MILKHKSRVCFIFWFSTFVFHVTPKLSTISMNYFYFQIRNQLHVIHSCYQLPGHRAWRNVSLLRARQMGTAPQGTVRWGLEISEQSGPTSLRPPPYRERSQRKEIGTSFCKKPVTEEWKQWTRKLRVLRLYPRGTDEGTTENPGSSGRWDTRIPGRPDPDQGV